MDINKLWSPEQVAEILDVSKQTLAVWRCERRYPLAYVKIGSRVRYRPADIQQFMQARLQQQPV